MWAMRSAADLRLIGEIKTGRLRLFARPREYVSSYSEHHAISKQADLQAFHAGGGTRTHGLRIMIPARGLRVSTGVRRFPCKPAVFGSDARLRSRAVSGPCVA
jgi:hypothetical protein